MSKTKKKTKKKTTKKTKKRYDGREAKELRPIKIESGVLPNADGSAYIEMGRNKVLVGVFGPRRCTRSDFRNRTWPL